MNLETIFGLCEPRSDILKGDIGKTDLAADLAQVIRNSGPDEYRKPDLFFPKQGKGGQKLILNLYDCWPGS